MNNLNKILNLMERIDENYHQYVTLINEDKRGKAAKNACYNVFRQYFNNDSFLDREFVHQDNPEHLSAIDYMYKQFMDAFYHDPATRAGAVMRLAPMFLRLALESGFQQGHEDANKLNRLRNILNYIHQSNKTKGLDISQISVNTTFDELNNTFGKEIDNQNASMKDRINNGVYDENNNFNGYKIVGPLTFEEANRYGNESCPDSKLCYTQGSSTWNSYTSEGINNAYVLLRDGWENVPPEHDDESNSAYDTYGLSMIFVFVDGQGDLAYCNTRWNHSANYKSGSSCDHALNEEEITQLIGRNFYSVFKPNNKWNELVEDALTRLKNGEDPRNVFDYFEDYLDDLGIAIIRLKDVFNVINSNNKILSPNQWFHEAELFNDNFILVEISDKQNLMNFNGELMSNVWYSYISSNINKNGLTRVRNENHLYNFLNINEGRVISPDQWFDEVGLFGFNGAYNIALVRATNGKINFIKENGELLSKQWFYRLAQFKNGRARVENDDFVFNFIDQTGELISEEWFVGAYNFGAHNANNLALVIKDGEYGDKLNFIDTNGNKISEQWFDRVDAFEDGIARVYVYGRNFDELGNYINTNGELLSPNQWFDWNSRFTNNIAFIKNDGKYNFIDRSGKILFNTWFDSVTDFDNRECGIACVKLGDEYNYVDVTGKLLSPNQGFAYASTFDGKDYATVRVNYNDDFCRYILRNGKIVNRQPE